MGNASILVVDDEPEILVVLATRLRARGYQVATATSGDGALDAIRKAPPDLVLLDVMMPGRSGWEILRELRTDPTTKAVKVVLLSAIGEQANEAAAWQYGADGHVDKPFEFGQLEMMIERVLATRSA